MYKQKFYMCINECQWNDDIENTTIPLILHLKTSQKTNKTSQTISLYICFPRWCRSHHTSFYIFDRCVAFFSVVYSIFLRNNNFEHLTQNWAILVRLLTFSCILKGIWNLTKVWMPGLYRKSLQYADKNHKATLIIGTFPHLFSQIRKAAIIKLCNLWVCI